MSHHSTPILLSLPKLTLLGPPQSEIRNIRKMFFFGGDKIYVKFVEHLSDFETFFEQMQNVRAVIRDLSHLWGGRQISVEEYMERTRREWLHGVVRSFVSKYGENSVPEDIRVTIGKAADALGEEVVYDWPEFEYVEFELNDGDFLQLSYVE